MIDPELQKLFDDLVRFTGGDLDPRHGECHITCPACGHESSPKDPHCSFSVNGWYCFPCTQGGSLHNLAKRLNYQPDGQYRPLPAPRKAPEKRRTDVPYWMTLESPETALERYENHLWRIEAWEGYKQLQPETIIKHRLGVGALPKYSSKCPHMRLIVPVFWGSVFVGFRGRSIHCDCGKWLATAGFRYDIAPLYNEDALRPGCVVWIVENPIDALMVTERTNFIGLATYSIAYWKDEWTETIAKARPELVIVAFDNDLPGNGGGPRRREFERRWRSTHNNRPAPQPRGPRLVNLLRQAHLPARLYDWGRAENKADIGGLLMAA